MPTEFSDNEEEVSEEANAICISAAALGDISTPAVTTMKLKVQMQGLSLIFLVDSGSTHSFIDCAMASKLQGVSKFQSEWSEWPMAA